MAESYPYGRVSRKRMRTLHDSTTGSDDEDSDHSGSPAKRVREHSPQDKNVAPPQHYRRVGGKKIIHHYLSTDEDSESDQPPAKRFQQQGLQTNPYGATGGNNDESSSGSSSEDGSEETPHHGVEWRGMGQFQDSEVVHDSQAKGNTSRNGEYLAEKMKGSNYSSFSQRLMAKMGYVVGKGLGKEGTGIAEPIQESVQKGRRGLGYELDGLEAEDVQWEQEEVLCEQRPLWLDPCPTPVPHYYDFANWETVGNRKETIADETTFCDPQILTKILNAKSVFDNLSNKEFLDARQRSNPFETIKGAIFQNRAAMKMANIDSVFGFMFTCPRSSGKEIIGPNDVLYFADICAGPGGFSEYVLYRKTWHAKGFGLTLKDPDSASDFKLDQFLAAPCETFDPHYGVGGYDGDGDITNPSNLDAFQKYVLEQTDRKGVHFVMADGGISVEGQENIQEILTKQLVLCQYICALSVLRIGGHFLCKVFDMFTPFSVGLFYLLYRCFRCVCLFKPVTSRPANSERYVICKDLLPGSKAIHQYMYELNLKLINLKTTEAQLDILEVVPRGILEEDENFLKYIVDFNDTFGAIQLLNLKKLQYFVRNSNLLERRQAGIRKKCLELWKIPNEPRKVRSEDTAFSVFQDIWKNLDPQPPANFSCLQSKNFVTVNRNNLNFLRDVHSWKWSWACGKRLMLVGLGRSNVKAWDMTSEKPVFSERTDLRGIELPSKTVIEVELVSEFRGEDRGQRRIDTIYIVDVLVVNGKVYGNNPLKERQLIAEKLCKVLNKPCRKGVLLLKTRPQYRAAHMKDILSLLKMKKCKLFPQPVPTVSVGEKEDNAYIAPVGVIFYRSIRDPWQLHVSSKGQFYYFNTKTKENGYDCPKSSVAPYIYVTKSRHIWRWNKQIHNELCSEADGNSESEDLTRSYLCQVIRQYLVNK